MRPSIIFQNILLLALAVMLDALAVLAADDYAGAESCLDCHNNMPAAASIHDEAFAGIGKHLLPEGREDYRCEACHGPSGTHARRQSGGPWRLPPAVFHDQHEVTAGNAMCSGCHSESMEGLGPHAQSFHATARRNELSCSRCHGGVAHGLPDWVVELRERQMEERAP